MKKLIILLVLIVTACRVQSQVYHQNVTIEKVAPQFYLNGTGAQVRLYNSTITESAGNIVVDGGNLSLATGRNLLLNGGTIGTAASPITTIYGTNANFVNTPSINGTPISSIYAPLSNPSFSNITISSTPVNPSDAANKAYVDLITTLGVFWVAPVEDIVTAEPGGTPAAGLRWIDSDDNKIYTSNGSGGYTSALPGAGTSCFVKADSAAPANSIGQYNFNGSAWVNIGGSNSHNDLISMDGGELGYYGHLTSAQHVIATQAASTTLSGYLTSTDWNTFNGKLSASGSAASLTNFPTLNQNTSGSAAKWTTARSLAGNSVDGSANVAFSNKFVVQGTTDAGLSAAQFLGALGTGIVKNTTTTGILSIAAAGDFPTLNQNTTGSAAKWTTARTLAGNSTDGSTNVAFSNKFIVQGTADAGLSGAQFMGALGTGIIKNTTTTGVFSIAAAGDFPTLNQNTTGSAATLTTTRAIYGNNFNGSAALAQVIASTYGGTGNGFFKVSGPATTEKTMTAPNANFTVARTDAAQSFSGIQTFSDTIKLPAAWYVATTLLTSTGAELNKLHGVTATSTNFNHLVGSNSNIQQQINDKAPIDNTDLTGLTIVERLQIGASDSALIISAAEDAGAGLTVRDADGNQVPYNEPEENTINISDIAVMQDNLKAGSDTVATRAYARGYGGTGTMNPSDTAAMLTPYVNRNDVQILSKPARDSVVMKYKLINGIYFIAANDGSALEKAVANITCDGTADQVQINAALTAGYNVRLSSGTFNISNSITAAVNNVTIEGAGKQKTTIYQSNGANADILTIGGNFWTIKNLLINANLASNTGTCNGIYGDSKTNVTIENCEIKNVEDHAVYIFGTSNEWHITNCYIHDNTRTNIKGTTFSGQAPYNIYINYCKFSNTTAESQIHARTEDVIATGPYNWNIDHCTVSGTTGYMGILFELAKNCNVTNSYLDVGEAIGAGNPANIRYKDGAGGKVIGNTFAGNGNTTTENYSAISLWGAVDIIVSGNYFTSLNSKDGSGISVEAYSTGYNVSNILIDGNTFYNISTNDHKEIIALQAATTYTLSDVNITNNIFKDDRGAGAYSDYAVVTTDAGTVKNVNISNNIIEGVLTTGIYLSTNGDNFNISGNTFIDLPTGVLADDGDDIQITNNKFVLCTTPIDVNDSDVNYPLIEGNTMRGCTNSGSYSGASNEIIGINVWHDGTYDNTNP